MAPVIWPAYMRYVKPGFVFLPFVVIFSCGIAASIAGFSLAGFKTDISYWVLTGLALVFSLLSWASFQFLTWRREPTTLRRMCPIFALGLGLDFAISLPFTVRSEESPYIRLFRSLPLLICIFLVIYIATAWLCLVRHASSSSLSIYQPLATIPNHGVGHDFDVLTNTSAGRCADLFKVQHQTIREDRAEGIQPTPITGGLASASNRTRLERAENYDPTTDMPKEAYFHPALVFEIKDSNYKLRWLVTASSFTMIYSAIHLALQISHYYGNRDSSETCSG